MKKYAFIVASLLLMSAFYSCKKEYVCKCEIYSYADSLGNIKTYKPQKDSIRALRKKKADKFCVGVADSTKTSTDSLVVCYAYTYDTRN